MGFDLSRNSGRLVVATALLAPFGASGSAKAALAVSQFNREWWLNPNYAEHGAAVDHIFYFIFWLTTIVLIGVQAVLVYFLIKYRRRPGNRKGVYTHGNTRLEMFWTLIPAIILIVVALWTKRAWDEYRYNPAANDPNTLKVLVIGEQFAWNVIYPGPNGKIGRYLLYPKSTDLKWPPVPPGKDFRFPNVAGPAFLPEDQARQVLSNYIQNVNPLGRDYSDPNTDPLPPAGRVRLKELARRTDLSADEQKELERLTKIESLNDYSNANSRALVIPKGRAVEIQVSSRDVIHDFFLPNFRTRLDTVPGTKGRLYLTATKTCKEVGGGARAYTPDDLQDLVVKQKRDVTAIVNAQSPGAEHYVKKRPHKVDYWRYADKNGETIVRDGGPVTEDTVKALRDAGVARITAIVPFYWDIVCEELCGLGHYKMKGTMIVVDPSDLGTGDYVDYFPPGVAGGAPAEKPAGVATAQ